MHKICHALIRGYESINRHRLWLVGLSLTMAVGCTAIQSSAPFDDQPSGPLAMEQVPLITLMLWHAKDLSLTPKQIQALDRLRSDFQRQTELQAAELQRRELDLRRLLSAEKIDLAQVETGLRKIEALRTDLRMSRIRTIEQGKATLTPEQWRKFQPLVRGGL